MAAVRQGVEVVAGQVDAEALEPLVRDGRACVRPSGCAGIGTTGCAGALASIRILLRFVNHLPKLSISPQFVFVWPSTSMPQTSQPTVNNTKNSNEFNCKRPRVNVSK